MKFVNRTEQNRTEQNPYRASFGRRTELLQNLFYCKTKSCKVYFGRLIGLLLVIRNKVLSLIILNFFMQFSKFLNAHPSGHKARGYAFLSLSNTGFDFRTAPLLFNFKIKKIFFALLSFFILFTISCGKVYFSRLIWLLLVIRNKILSLIILKFFMQFSKFLNAHPSGHKARGHAFLSLSNTGFDFRTTPLLFNFKIKKIFFTLLSFFILFTISCGNENKTKNEIYKRNISYYAGDWINSDTKEKIFIINSNGSIIVNGENILPKSIKKNSETNYTFKVMPEWINKSSYTFNINFINDAKGKVNVGNLYFEINKIN